MAALPNHSAFPTEFGSQTPTAASAATAQQLKLSVCAEKTQLSAAGEHTLEALVSLKAPDSAPTQRQPLEIVAVVDRSGSMSGSKMTAMKEALTFLVSHGLQKEDRFALVAFDNSVELRVPVMPMDAAGENTALKTVGDLRTGGSTNLSGGLLMGIDVLKQSCGGHPNANKAVLLFTDGMANNGITDSHGIVAAAQGAMAGSPMTCFTFGFGADHSETLLRTLSEQTNGLYYYVEKSEDIPVSFADCLGGLVSVVAQNAVLHLQGLDSNMVAKAHCHYKQDAAQPGSIVLQLGDIYAEDEKDVVVTLKLPALTAVQLAQFPAIRATARYFSVASAKMEEVEAELLLSRPDQTPDDQLMPSRLAEQLERVRVSEAILKATELADSGSLDQGREVLQAAVRHAKASPFADSFVVSNLIQETMGLEAGYSDQYSYASSGAKKSKMSAMSNMQQRSTHSAGVQYERKSKLAMKSLFAVNSAPAYEPTSPTSEAASSSPVQTETVRSKKKVTSQKKTVFRMPSLRSLSGRSSVDLD